LKKTTLIFFAFCIHAMYANELVDAFKGKKTDYETTKSITISKDRKSCDEALIDAIQKNHIAYFRGLKGRLKETNDCLVSNDLTPLMMAAYVDRTQIVKLFLTDGVDVNETNTRGYTALHFAAFYGNYEVAVALLDGGADIDYRNGVGQTPLMVAAFYGNAKTASILLNRGANEMIRDVAGYTALELAVKRNKKEVISVMNKNR